MTALAYYNEIDPFAAQWLRNLIDAGHIAPGIVDTRSIEDVTPNDLKGFTQCHFFAGIGVWSYALRLVGWPDSKPIWTGSCPCQPFSPAGKGKGFDDERHLWPAFHWLIAQCRPLCVAGEQSASADAALWLDLVQADMEAVGYAFGAVAFPSAGVGAPHQRDRSYWVADTDCQQRQGGGELQAAGWHELANSGYFGDMADAFSLGWEGRLSGREDPQRQVINGSPRCCGATGGLAYTNDHRQQPSGRGWGGSECAKARDNTGRCGKVGFVADTDNQQRQIAAPTGSYADISRGWNEGAEAVAGRSSNLRPGPVNGFWRSADWLHCQDGKWRAVRSESFPLVNGVAGRVGQLRAYGNAVNAYAAAAFLKSYMAAVK